MEEAEAATSQSSIDWIAGDAFGFPLPAHIDALLTLPKGFHTQAFHACGSLPLDDAVVNLTGLWECHGGATPEFQETVPRCMHAHYHHESGSGLLITEHVSFGRNGIEPNYVKCLDRDLPNPYGHYQALLRALAKLAGS
jgi:hypothetical protein